MGGEDALVLPCSASAAPAMLVASHTPLARSLHVLLVPLAPLDGPCAAGDHPARSLCLGPGPTVATGAGAAAPAAADRSRRSRSVQHEATLRCAAIFSDSEVAAHQCGRTTQQPAVGAATDDPSHSAAAARPRRRSYTRLIRQDRVLSSCIRLYALIRGRVRRSPNIRHP